MAAIVIQFVFESSLNTLCTSNSTMTMVGSANNREMPHSVW